MWSGLYQEVGEQGELWVVPAVLSCDRGLANMVEGVEEAQTGLALLMDWLWGLGKGRVKATALKLFTVLCYSELRTLSKHPRQDHNQSISHSTPIFPSMCSCWRQTPTVLGPHQVR